MTALDVKHAKQALAWRLREWGTEQPDARAAGFIDDLVSKGWQMSPDREARPKPPRVADACRTCGREMHAPDRICEQPTKRPAAADPPTDTYLAAKNGLHATTDTSPEEDEG